MVGSSRRFLWVKDGTFELFDHIPGGLFHFPATGTTAFHFVRGEERNVFAYLVRGGSK